MKCGRLGCDRWALRDGLCEAHDPEHLPLCSNCRQHHSPALGPCENSADRQARLREARQVTGVWIDEGVDIAPEVIKAALETLTKPADYGTGCDEFPL